MKKFLLIASAASLAVAAAAPALAEREGRGKSGEHAQQSEQRGSDRRAAKQQQASDRGAARQQAMSDRRSAMQQERSDRRSAQQQQISDRRAFRQQAVSDRRSARQQEVSDRRGRVQQAQSERRSFRQQQLSDRESRRQQAQSDRRGRIQQQQSDRKSVVQQARGDRRERFQEQRAERRAVLQQSRAERRAVLQQSRAERRDAIRLNRAERRGDKILARSFDDRPRLTAQSWQERGERLRLLSARREAVRQQLRLDEDDLRQRSLFTVGQQVNPNWWADDYVPLRYASLFDDDDDYYYRYDGDYLYQLRDDDHVVLSLFPLLGGAYSVGNPLPFYQSSYYNVPYGYSGLYYDRPDAYYRYGDGAIYQVDPTTQLIAGIVALLTGQNLGIGQMLPSSFGAYNVPYAYRDRYYDSDDMWYRYGDGYIYGVDPDTRLIEARYPVYGGYAVGDPWTSYAGYDYGVPDYYGDLYYEQPGYDYRFASNGIYQVDPKTQLVSALVALVTGQNFAVGQPMPTGYDVYNVPFAFRDDYYDSDDDWYRYADGRIYQLDPRTRVIERVIMV